MPVAVDQFLASLKNRLLQPLPGALAHDPLRAISIGNVRPNFEHRLPPRPASVLILLYPDGGKIKFPLTKRHDYVGTHGGQVSLPGGKAEAGETAEQTALREAQEEIGIDTGHVTIIGRLTEFFVIPSNIIVTPVVGFQYAKPAMVPDPKEVDKILEGSIEQLLHDDAVLTKEILAARIYQLRAPHFLIDNEVVWGATAMILNEFRYVLRDIA